MRKCLSAVFKCFKTSHKKRIKMEKTPRYTQRERNMVLGFAAQYKDVIENKRTDAESNRKKDEVWRQIAKEFNARVYHQRSSKQLRQLYKNMKLLLKKDLCGDGKGNRSFMDLLNTLSQQESVAQYISEQMSPSGGAYNSRQPKYDDDYDDSKNPFPSVGFDGMDPDVIVIKSEDISDNEQSQNGGNPEDMDDDDDDCLSPKDIPEVCLEEEDDEIFATDLRQSTPLPQQHQSRQSFHATAQQQQQQQQPGSHQQQPEVTIQNVGGIRVGSIGSLANLKALQNGNNSALSITHASNNGGGNGNGNANSSNNNSGSNGSNNTNSSQNPSANNNRRSSAEQAQQHLLLNGLGLSAVHPPEPPLPTLQRATHANNSGSNSNNNNNNNNSHSNSNSLLNSANQLLLSLGVNTYSSHKHGGGTGTSHGHRNSPSNNNNSGAGSHSAQHSRSSDYLMTLAIEERKRKIDLLDAQIEYWKTLTRKLDANATHNPMPSCACHFPGKVNGLQTPASSS